MRTIIMALLRFREPSGALRPTTSPAPIGHASVAAVLESLRAEPSAQFREQRGWTVVASRERGYARRMVLHARRPRSASGRRQAHGASSATASA